MRMPSQEKTLQRLQNPAETLCERPRAGTAQATASTQSSQTSQTQEHSRQTDACSATA